MKNHDPGITVTEDSLHCGVRPKPWEAVRVMELKPTLPWRHPRSMPDSRDSATPLAPAPRAPGSPFATPTSPTREREEPDIEPCGWFPVRLLSSGGLPPLVEARGWDQAAASAERLSIPSRPERSGRRRRPANVVVRIVAPRTRNREVAPGRVEGRPRSGPTVPPGNLRETIVALVLH